MKYFFAFLIILLLPASARAEFKLYTENDLNISEFGVSIDDQKDNITIIATQGGPSLEAAFCAAFSGISELISTSISGNSRETSTRIAGFEVNAEYEIEENGQKTNMTEIVQISEGNLYLTCYSQISENGKGEIVEEYSVIENITSDDGELNLLEGREDNHCRYAVLEHGYAPKSDYFKVIIGVKCSK